MCLGVIDAGFSGGFYDIKFRQSGKFWICDRNDCYTWDGGKNYLQCDDDKGDVGDHVFAIVQTGKYSKNFGAMECCLETSGDLWRDRSGRFLWCDKGTSCKGGSVKFDYGFEFCAMNRTKDMGNKRPLLIDAGIKTENNQTTIKQYVGCLRCQKDYERPDKDYNFTSRDGCSGCKVTRDECVPAEMIDCFRAIDRKETANWNGKSCNCGSRDGVNYSWDSKQKKCVKGSKTDPEPNPNPKKTCADMYEGYPERIACCEAGAATEWKGDLKTGKCLCKRYKADNGVEIPMRPVLSLGKVNGKMTAQCVPNLLILAAKCCVRVGGTWIASDAEEVKGRCDCGSGKKFHFEQRQNEQICECIAGDGDNSTPIPPVTSTECTDAECTITIKQSIKCSYNDNYFNSTENYSVCKEDLDAQRLDCDGLKARVNACTDTDCIRKLLTRIDAYDELIKRVCDGSGVVPTPVPDNGAEILAAENTLTSFFRNAESNASVWKDKDGNFNTARLASDLTAGVILGTVGGVVSGVVIKKKQVEKGFDALHCTVGGQTVADWGDIFNVGLRR